MYRILAIDDDAIVRSLLQAALGSAGYQCVMASSANDGERACEQMKPDLILLDVNLPDGHGVEFCRRLKADPALRHIPILILTGEASSVESRVQGLEAGADDYVLKPFLPKELIARVRSILKASTGPTRP